MSYFGNLSEGQFFAYKGREYVKVTQESEFYNAVEKFDSSAAVKFDDSVEVTCQKEYKFRIVFEGVHDEFDVRDFDSHKSFLQCLKSIDVENCPKFWAFDDKGEIQIDNMSDLIEWVANWS